MLSFGLLELEGISLPVEYNDELRTLWFLCILPGMLLIIMVVSMTFESIMRRALVDVEAQKATIEEQSAALEKLVEEKDNIIAILAHDLRNPLSNMGILAKMTREETNAAEQNKLLRLIEKSSNNAQLLVKDVLEMATLEQGSTVKLQPIDAQTIVDEVMQSLKAAAESKEIEIKEKTSGASTKVFADPTYFRQVIENLISNAVKFSPVRKDIHVSIEEYDQFIEIRVRDYGQGVPADEEHRLFKRFSRLSPQPTAGESSSGLGLSLVKQYMELMGGNVRHERPTDGGAVFIAKFLKA
jgi:signal transduction histidine kinase